MKSILFTAPHKIMRHVFYVIGGILMLAGVFMPAVSIGQQFSDTDFPYDTSTVTPLQGDNEPTNLGQVLKTDTVNPTTSILKRLTDFFRLSGTAYDKVGSTSKATDYVKWILNLLLGLVSFLSLVMVIFAFYLIFFSKGEDGVVKARKILIGVAIALAIMGLSWLIASLFFYIYQSVT